MMMTYEFTSRETGDETFVDAESFEIACYEMFGHGDEYDLDPLEWECTAQYELGKN